MKVASLLTLQQLAGQIVIRGNISDAEHPTVDLAAAVTTSSWICPSVAKRPCFLLKLNRLKAQAWSDVVCKREISKKTNKEPPAVSPPDQISLQNKF